MFQYQPNCNIDSPSKQCLCASTGYDTTISTIFVTLCIQCKSAVHFLCGMVTCCLTELKTSGSILVDKHVLVNLDYHFLMWLRMQSLKKKILVLSFLSSVVANFFVHELHEKTLEDDIKNSNRHRGLEPN